MTPRELQNLLRDLIREKRALRQQHEEAAQRVDSYDVNNTYQYIIERENAHVAWLRDAIAAVGGEIQAEDDPEQPVPAVLTGPVGAGELYQQDAARMAEFLERWRPRIAAVTHARHRLMLHLILGEMAEQRRFFEQAAGGRTDLLGRRTGGYDGAGRVLPTRWVE